MVGEWRGGSDRERIWVLHASLLCLLKWPRYEHYLIFHLRQEKERKRKKRRGNEEKDEGERERIYETEKFRT